MAKQSFLINNMDWLDAIGFGIALILLLILFLVIIAEIILAMKDL